MYNKYKKEIKNCVDLAIKQEIEDVDIRTDGRVLHYLNELNDEVAYTIGTIFYIGKNDTTVDIQRMGPDALFKDRYNQVVDIKYIREHITGFKVLGKKLQQGCQLLKIY